MATSGRPPTSTLKLEMLGIEALCDEIISGKTMRKVARELDVDIAVLSKWVDADPQRKRLMFEARVRSAQAADELAEEVLENESIDPMRARELAQHYRWRASKVNPRDYGDKLQVDSTHTLRNLTDAQIDARQEALNKRIAQALEDMPPLPAIEGPSDVG